MSVISEKGLDTAGHRKKAPGTQEKNERKTLEEGGEGGGVAGGVLCTVCVVFWGES